MMLRNDVKRLALAVTAGIAAASIVVQHHAIIQLREQNESLRGQLVGLAELQRANGVLSSRLAETNDTQSSPNQPAHELLKLRGQVGLLRRQLLELQQLMSAQSPTQMQAHLLLSEGTLKRVEALQVERQAEYARARTLTEWLKEKASDPEALAQAMLASGLQDTLLIALLEQREIAVQRLGLSQKDLGSEDHRTELLANQVAELKAKIDERSQGILLGLVARADSLKEPLDALQSEVDKAKENSQ